MGCLDVSAVQIVVSEYGAAYGTQDHATILDSQIGHGLADEFVKYSVPAARTVMGGRGRSASLPGKLAVHPGVSSDNLFLCRHTKPPPLSSP